MREVVLAEVMPHPVVILCLALSLPLVAVVVVVRAAQGLTRKDTTVVLVAGAIQLSANPVALEYLDKGITERHLQAVGLMPAAVEGVLVLRV